MLRITLLFLALLAGIRSNAIARQNKENKAEPVAEKIVKFGKVDPEEFNVRPTGPDSSAAAIVLFDKGTGRFELSERKMGFIYVFERHLRYKIIDKTAYNLANIEIPLFNIGDNQTSLHDFEAATYNLENGQIVPAKIGRSSKFTEHQDKNYTFKKFALPNVKEGSIIEFKYEIRSDFLYTLMPWYFQREIPTQYSEFDISIPDFLRYNISQNGLLKVNPYKEAVVQKFRIYGNELQGRVIRSVFRAGNLPAMKQEKFITTINDYIGKVEFELNGMAMPGTSFLDYVKTWPKIVNELRQTNTFGGFLSPRGEIKEVVAKVVSKDSKPDTIPFLLFDYVKKNLKWNHMNAIYASSKGPDDVLKKGTGNSADINLTLLALLREAKVDAVPIILSTRSNGKHPGLPMITKFNNVIIDVAIGEKHIFFDATNKNHTPDIIDFDNLNHQGLRVDFAANSGTWVNTDEFKTSKKVISSVLTLDKDNKLNGTMQVLTTNYEALARRNRLTEAQDRNEYIKQFSKENPGLNVTEYNVDNLDNPNESLFETIKVSIADNVESAGNLLFFSPTLFERTRENPFAVQDRKYPVDFGYPVEEVNRITIEIPEGYTLDKLPENERISLLQDAASFSFQVSREDNKISMVSKISFKKDIYDVQEYHDLRELFNNIVRKQTEQIVLKKN